ncbi:hypothetical protein N7447_010654 [Penicillium robsamsonii]|uniref:uncharacterized protein n=1 Tax=Penicillium robsamsonii TaxID=1792511 RepID=UPI0025482D92|nr:uncharacterized protein N7447_010654 [Penicillium robsamsonii]KAJ5811138.1 hypothetical protein N7447_010654 [Penicillium robsamsonii]
MNGVLGKEPEGAAYGSIGRHELGKHFRMRYQLTDDISDLVKAIEEMRLCVELALDDFPSKPFSLEMLSVVLAMYDESSQEDHLSEAIEAIERAIRLLDIDHPDHQRLNYSYRRLRRKKARGFSL